MSVRTDEFGDFWADGLERGTYRVSIQKEGYATKELGPIEVDKDLNVGDVAVHRGGQP